VMGFETGLREWRRLLAPGGHLAVTDAVWMKPDPPPECAAFWAEEYPAIRPVPALLQAIAECGYETVGHFPLPASSWWDDYYRPLQRNVTQFRERHHGRTTRGSWPAGSSVRSTSGTPSRSTTATSSS